MPEPKIKWKRGDRVSITYLNRTVTGRVEIASENGEALMLAFEALLGGFAGHMPVSWYEETSEFRDIIMGATVELAEGDSKEGRLSA